jgi:putative heme-binding domain-containing protein
LRELTANLAEAGPLELPQLLGAYERTQSGAIGEALLAALARSPALESLSSESLRRTLNGYPDDVRSKAAGLFERLEAGRSAQQARLAELEPLLTEGKAAAGRAVFFGGRAACSSCHLVNAEGGRVGPDLSKIASIRTGRDLLEALVFPSASFVRGYEPYLVVTQEGLSHTGTLARETVDAIFLHTPQGAELRLPRDRIDEFHQGRVSIMPQGLDAQLPREQLADLLAFLQSLK